MTPEQEQRISATINAVGFDPKTEQFIENDEAMAERTRRITRLIEGKMMTPRAAATVVDAAMFGEGCTEGRVREGIQKRIDKGLPAHIES